MVLVIGIFVTEALGMHSSSLPQIAALVTLGNRTTFGFDLDERSVGVGARRSSVTFDARFAIVCVFFVNGWVGDMGGVGERNTMQTSCR